jgi:hypothetical protein
MDASSAASGINFWPEEAALNDVNSDWGFGFGPQDRVLSGRNPFDDDVWGDDSMDEGALFGDVLAPLDLPPTTLRQRMNAPPLPRAVGQAASSSSATTSAQNAPTEALDYIPLTAPFRPSPKGKTRLLHDDEFARELAWVQDYKAKKQQRQLALEADADYGEQEDGTECQCCFSNFVLVRTISRQLSRSILT